MIQASVQPFPAFELGPELRAQILSDAAAEILVQTDAEDQAALGGEVSSVTLVDGTETADLSRVHAEGTIVRTYDIMPAVLMQIGEWLWQHSPVRTGRYQRSHRLLADGSEIAEVTDGWSLPATLPEASELAFTSAVNYAPLIEPHDGAPGESRQAPDGVYQVIAAIAADQFGQFADIRFDTIGSEPAIILKAI